MKESRPPHLNQRGGQFPTKAHRDRADDAQLITSDRADGHEHHAAGRRCGSPGMGRPHERRHAGLPGRVVATGVRRLPRHPEQRLRPRRLAFRLPDAGRIACCGRSPPAPPRGLALATMGYTLAHWATTNKKGPAAARVPRLHMLRRGVLPPASARRRGGVRRLARAARRGVFRTVAWSEYFPHIF